MEGGVRSGRRAVMTRREVQCRQKCWRRPVCVRAPERTARTAEQGGRVKKVELKWRVCGGRRHEPCDSRKEQIYTQDAPITRWEKKATSTHKRRSANERVSSHRIKKYEIPKHNSAKARGRTSERGQLEGGRYTGPKEPEHMLAPCGHPEE